jgi:hypothetical protein
MLGSQDDWIEMVGTADGYGPEATESVADYGSV